jgi:hypothetical protein
MNVILVTVLQEGKAIFELEEEDRLVRRQIETDSAGSFSFCVRPNVEVAELHDMPNRIFTEILIEAEQRGFKYFGDDFRVLRFAFWGFSRCFW